MITIDNTNSHCFDAAAEATKVGVFVVIINTPDSNITHPAPYFATIKIIFIYSSALGF